MSDQKIRLIELTNPFEPTERNISELDYERTKSLADYLESIPGEVAVSVSGKVIDNKEIPLYYPKHDDTIVVAHVPLGGSGSGKAIMRMVAILAVSYFTLGTGTPALLAGMGPTAQLVAFTAGSMLINAIMPTAGLNQKSEDLGDGNSYGIDGAKNTSTEGIPVPLVYGNFRAAGNFIGFYTENIEDTQNLYMLLNAGEGPISGISKIEINGNPIENYQDVDTQVRLGSATQTAVNWFDDIVIPHNLGVTVTDAFFTYQTQDEIDKFRIDLVFPAGLFSVDDDDGDIDPWEVSFYGEYKKSSDANWTILKSAVVVDSSTKIYVYSPHEVYDADGNYVSTTAEIRTETLNPGDTEDGNGNIVDSDGYVVGYVDYDVTYSGDLKIRAKKRSAYRVSFESPQLDQGVYDIRFRRTNAESSNENVSDQVIWTDINEIKLADVGYRNTALLAIKIRLSDQLSGVPNVTYVHGGKNIKFWDSTNSSWRNGSNNNPAWVAYDMLTNNRYGGGLSPARLDSYKWMEWALFCEANDLTFDGVFDTNSNVWDMIQHVFAAGHAQIIQVGTRYTIAIERESIPVQMFSTANIIEGSFHRSWLPLTERANEFEVSYYDKDDGYKRRTVKLYDEILQGPTSVVPQRTSNIDLPGITDAEQARKRAVLYLNMNRHIHETVTFEADLDAVACTVGDTILVKEDTPNWVNSGRTKTGSTTTQIELDSAVTLSQGVSYQIVVHHDLSAYASAQALVSGNYVFVKTSENPDDKEISRIKRVSTGIDYPVYTAYFYPAGTYNASAGWLCACPELVAAGFVDNEFAELYAADYIEYGSVVNNVTQDTVVTSVEVFPALEAAPSANRHWIFGKVDEIVGQYRVTSVSGDAEYTRTISGIEYRADVYDLTGNIVPPDITPFTGVPHVTILDAYEDYVTVGNNNVPRVTVEWESNVNDKLDYKGADVYVSLNGADFELMTTVTGNVKSYTLSGVQINDDIIFKVVAFDFDDERAPLSNAPTIAYTITGKTTSPSLPISLTVTPGFFEITLTWNLDPNYYDRHSVEIWADGVTGTGDYTQMELIGTTTDNHFTHTNLTPGGIWCYWIRIIDSSGNAGAFYPWDDINGHAGVGICATVREDVDEFIDIIVTDIDQSQLDQDLSSTIDLIDTQGALWDRVNELFRLFDDISQANLFNALSIDNLQTYYAQYWPEFFDDSIAQNNTIYDQQIIEINDDLVQQAASLTILGARVDDNVAAISNESVVRATEDEALAYTIDTVSARVDENEAAIIEEQFARATADEAFASQITALTAEVDQNQALIVQEQVVRATEDEALATSITTLAVRVDGNEAAIINEQIVRANGDSVLASQIDTLGVRIDGAEAAIQQEQTARIEGDETIATLITTVQTVVDGNYAVIQEHAESINGIQAEWSLKIDVNGHVGGMGLINDGTTVDFAIRADRFWITDATTEEKPFIVQDGKVIIRDAVIGTATIGTLHLINGSVTESISTTGTGTSVTLNYQVGDASEIGTGVDIVVMGFFNGSHSSCWTGTPFTPQVSLSLTGATTQTHTSNVESCQEGDYGYGIPYNVSFGLKAFEAAATYVTATLSVSAASGTLSLIMLINKR